MAKLLLAAAVAYVLLHSLTLIDASPPPSPTEQMLKNMNPVEIFLPIILQLLKSIIITFGFFMQFLIPGILLAAAFCQMGRETLDRMKHMCKRKL